jgi:hypothetical protein
MAASKHRNDRRGVWHAIGGVGSAWQSKTARHIISHQPKIKRGEICEGEGEKPLHTEAAENGVAWRKWRKTVAESQPAWRRRNLA